ncbi:DUF1127 domain-containing protein [Rhodobacter sp. NSM]
MFRMLLHRHGHRCEMRKLLELPDYQLEDFGVTREDIRRALMRKGRV